MEITKHQLEFSYSKVIQPEATKIWVNLPINAIILDIQEEDGDIFLYALGDPKHPLSSRELEIYRTGLANPTKKYLKTLNFRTHGVNYSHHFEFHFFG